MPSFIFQNSRPVLESERLRMRLPGTTGDLEGDIDAMTEILRDGDVMRYITGRPMTRDEVAPALGRSATYFARNKMGGFLVERKRDGKIIGDCLLVPIPRRGVDAADASARGPEIELGYRLAKHAWGNGYASEAATAALHYAFASDGGNQDLVIAVTDLDNLASQRVLQKIGMVDEGKTEEFYEETLRLFTLTREQWQKNAGQKR